MVGKFINSFLFERNGKKCLGVKLINSKGFEKVAYLYDSKYLNVAELANSLIDLGVGTPIAIDVDVVPNIVTGERKVYYNGVYFAGVKVE